MWATQVVSGGFLGETRPPAVYAAPVSDEQSELRARIRAAMQHQEKRVTQAAVAKALGMTPSQVSKRLTTKKKPIAIDAADVPRWAAAIGVSVTTLLPDAPSPPPIEGEGLPTRKPLTTMPHTHTDDAGGFSAKYRESEARLPQRVHDVCSLLMGTARTHRGHVTELCERIKDTIRIFQNDHATAAPKNGRHSDGGR